MDESPISRSLGEVQRQLPKTAKPHKTRRRLVLYYLAFMAGVWSLTPILYVFDLSLMSQAQWFKHTLIPSSPDWGNFLRLFGLSTFGESVQVAMGFRNSIVVGLLVMLVTLGVAIPGAYALGRLRLTGGTAVFGLVLGTRMIPPLAIIMPTFLYFRTLHLWGTIAGIVIVQLSITLPIVTWVLAGFFRALPIDIEMSARMDGCSRFQAFRRALLPLAAPGIAASAVIAFLFSWNGYLYSITITSGSPAATFNAVIDSLGGGTLAAAICVQIAVAIVIAVFLQHYITSLKIVDPGTVAQ